MSAFWSWFIAVLTIASIVGIVWLLLATARSKSGGSADTTGHTWDGDLTEYNNPLPLWWLGLFLLTVIFGGLYLAFFPGLAVTPGSLGWTSAGQVRAELAETNRKLEAVFAQFRGKPVEALIGDAKAQEFGRNVFANNCAVCHGSDARGSKGYPNLTDNDWLYGGQADNVLTSILKGRQGAMPALGEALGEQGVIEAASYVLSLSGRKVDEQLAAAGKARYMTICVACHGPQAKGNALVGAPNLTDDVWLYGGSFEDVKTSIRNGRNGRMPTWESILGEDRARLVAAWVLAQSRPPAESKQAQTGATQP